MTKEDVKQSGQVPRQLALELPPLIQFGRDDFLVSSSNEQASSLIEQWPDWPARRALLVGPSGSGKSHLTAIWSAASGARIIDAHALTPACVPQLVATGAVAVEDLRPGVDETALFHLFNLVGEAGAFLLVTSAHLPGELGLAIPDLLSRLRVMTMAMIATPDDALLRQLLVKLFLDRQIVVDSSVIDFLAVRIERSFSAINRIVAVLDREGLSQGRRITRVLAGELLRNAAAADRQCG